MNLFEIIAHVLLVEGLLESRRVCTGLPAKNGRSRA